MKTLNWLGVVVHKREGRQYIVHWHGNIVNNVNINCVLVYWEQTNECTVTFTLWHACIGSRHPEQLRVNEPGDYSPMDGGHDGDHGPVLSIIYAPAYDDDGDDGHNGERG